MKLFKRKSKKSKKDKLEESVKNEVNEVQPEENIGRSASTEESVVSVDPRDSLFPTVNELKKDKSGKNVGTTVISARDGADKFKVSQVRDSQLHTTTGYKSKRATTVPTARSSAYSGPPRYDWIDVEAAAAIKVQSVFRRHMVLTQLEREGKTTAAMRNKVRSRNAQRKIMSSEDVPTIFRFCGIGFLFADATGEDTLAMNEASAAKRDEKFNEKLEKDKKLRAFKMRNKPEIELEEAVEVVDNVESFQDAK